MLDELRQFFSEAKARRVLKRASSILSKLDYEVVDSDQAGKSLAFRFDEDSLALFIADAGPFGSRIEATILLPAELVNLKLMSDIASIAYSYRCSASGLTHSGGQKARIEVVYAFGERFSKTDVAYGLSFVEQCINTIEARTVSKIEQTRKFKFDLSAFDDEDIPFFSTQMIGERKVFAHGDSWDAYIEQAANSQAIGQYTAAEIDHDINVVLACRDFEAQNGCSLAEVGDVVNIELARHRNNQLGPKDKTMVN